MHHGRHWSSSKELVKAWDIFAATSGFQVTSGHKTAFYSQFGGVSKTWYPCSSHQNSWDLITVCLTCACSQEACDENNLLEMWFSQYHFIIKHVISTYLNTKTLSKQTKSSHEWVTNLLFGAQRVCQWDAMLSLHRLQLKHRKGKLSTTAAPHKRNAQKQKQSINECQQNWTNRRATDIN